MKFVPFIFAAVASAAAASAAPFGDSDVGYFITPPGWAVTNIPARVGAQYMPAGTDATVIRLSVPAALGMCATLDACAERWWVPIFSYPSPGHRVWYDYIDFYAGTSDEWADFDFTSDPFDLIPALWPKPYERVISNTFGRIFFRVSDMLEDVRSRLRSLAGVYPTDSRFGAEFYGSSKFGGVDTVDYDWCERPDALDTTRSAFDGGLCLDWSCLSNTAWTGLYTATPGTVLLDYLDLDYDEFTNVVGRCRRDAPPPLPSIYDILTAATDLPTLSRSWLSFSNTTSRISADDFGWMNRLLAILDKTYLVTGYDGLPLVIFSQLDIHGEAEQSQSVTNGYFHLSLGPFDVPIATLAGIEFGDRNIPSPSIQRTESTINGATFAIRNMGAEASLNALGSVPLYISASDLNDLLPSPLANNESVKLRFFVYPSESENVGPCIDVIAWPDGDNGTTILLETIRVLDVVTGVPVVSGSFKVNAAADISATGRSLPYAALGAAYSETNSIPHVRPLPDQSAPGFVSEVKLQLASRRDWSMDNMTLDEYAAFSGSATSRSLDQQAMALAERVKVQCADDASSAFGEDLSDIDSSADDIIRHYLDSIWTDLRNSATATNGSWGVETVDEHQTAYLANTNGALRLFLADALNSWSELPQLTEGFYLYAAVSASCGDSTSTNAPALELSALYDFSAAVYWNWPAIPAPPTPSN